MDRRSVLGLGALTGALTLAGLSPRAFAQTDAGGGLPTDPTEIITLWPGTPPGGAGVKPVLQIDEHSTDPAHSHNRTAIGIATPLMFVSRPAKPDGSALLIAPGGGYHNEWFDGEGYDIARHFNRAGVTCFVLRYRLPAEGWTHRGDVPLQDAQRAIRLIRANAAKYGIDPARVGVMGFSAGGHVAGSLATRYDAKVYAPVDDADGQMTRPAFAALIYPVITMETGIDGGSRDHLLGPSPSAAQMALYSCDQQVSAAMPPCFICCAADDPLVPPIPNSLAMFQAVRGVNVPAALHVFEVGGHGFCIGGTVGKPVSAWPDLFARWAASHDWIHGPQSVPV
jgi:acetyl esterase/lipase